MCQSVYMKIDDKKYIIGSLSAESRPHLTFDLVFEKEFELSHDWKDGSVFFCGYTADNPDQEEFGPDFSDEDEDEEEDLILENGKVVPDVQVANPTKSKDAAKKPLSATKPKVTLVDPKKEESDKEEDSDDSDEELNDDSDDSDLSGDSDDDMSEDEETPKKAEPSKKRPSESATKTPVGTAKKAKSDTPQKTDGKKGSGHKATPHPSKQAVKKTVETPKSSGQVSCKSCSKTFNSEKGLESHSKAKHGGK